MYYFKTLWYFVKLLTTYQERVWPHSAVSFSQLCAEQTELFFVLLCFYPVHNFQDPMKLKTTYLITSTQLLEQFTGVSEITVKQREDSTPTVCLSKIEILADVEGDSPIEAREWSTTPEGGDDLLLFS
jgi:hypothetical protein